MAAPTNTLTSYAAVGNREDLENVIYKIAANKTPFTSNIGKDKATATYHEWQTFSLRTPVGTNKNVQGDDTTATAAKVTTRVGNRTQIFKESGSVSGTQEAVDAAGRASEMAWQKLQKGEELATDIEVSMLGNYASIAGDGSTAAQTAGALAWMTSNVSRGSGGSSGGFSGGTVAAATNGTQRAFTETLLKSVLSSSFSNGAPGITQAYMSAAQKGVFSAYGIADICVDAGKGEATIIGGADVYVGDFNTITTVPVQYGLTRDVLLIDPSYWAVGTLRPMKTEPLAKTGDAERFQIITEKCLIARNEKSSAVIADLS
ncbi:SU10 major capsid protein [Caulobacter segnis]